MSDTRRRGRADQEARAALRPIVESGDAVCWRCRRVIVPDPTQRGDGWDAGHVVSIGEGGHPDGARVPEHSDCNRRAGAELRVELARRRASRIDPSRWLA